MHSPGSATGFHSPKKRYSGEHAGLKAGEIGQGELLQSVPRRRSRPLGLALDRVYVAGFVEGRPERVGEDDPDEEDSLEGIWEDSDDRAFVLETLKNGVEIRSGRPPAK